MITKLRLYLQRWGKFFLRKEGGGKRMEPVLVQAYKCPYCDYAKTDKGQVRLHMENCPDKPPEKPGSVVRYLVDWENGYVGGFSENFEQLFNTKKRYLLITLSGYEHDELEIFPKEELERRRQRALRDSQAEKPRLFSVVLKNDGRWALVFAECAEQAKERASYYFRVANRPPYETGSNFEARELLCVRPSIYRNMMM